MKLTYYESNPSNFGDELNSYLWDELIEGDFFDTDSSTLFLGVGSILWNDYPKDSKKLVMGSGFGGYTDAPNVNDGTWDIRFVRGPRTASMLNISSSKVITDAAILASYLNIPSYEKSIQQRVGFMPHFQSIARANWEEVCNVAGIIYLDPTNPDVPFVLSQIKSCDFVISEAMHGVILADTLRVPWVPIQPRIKNHRNKWYDWTESMDISLSFSKCPQTSILDFWSSISGLYASGDRSQKVRKNLKYLDNKFILNGANALSKFSIEDAFLSKDTVFEARLSSALEELARVCNLKV